MTQRRRQRHQSPARAIQAGQFELLVDVKAWQLLGLTGAEFSQRWLRGDYSGSRDPVLVALDSLVLTHRWSPDDWPH